MTPDDDLTPGAHQVAVLSHGFWTRRFSADPTVLNQTMVINGQLMEIIGVTQEGFAGVQVGQTPDIFIPITMKAQMTPNWDGLGDRKDYWLNILGRLAPGTAASRLKQVASLSTAVFSKLKRRCREVLSSEPERFLNRPALLADGSQGRQILQSDTREPLMMLMGDGRAWYC